MVLAEPYFDIGPVGDMHHNFEKNVLHIERPLPTVASGMGASLGEAESLLASAKSKLYAARRLRPTPSVDRTLYTNWNAMMVSALIAAGRVLGDAGASELALKSLDRLLSADPFGHVIAYADSEPPRTPVPGVLEDFVFAGHAALDAWEATGEMRYFTAAQHLAEEAIARFYDEDSGGFFDTERLAAGEARLGALQARRKPLQDAPSPGGNPVAAALLLRVADLTGDDGLRAKAKATLECFAGVVEHFGLHCASYALALRRMVTPLLQVVVVGADAAADALESAALKGFRVNKSVLRLRSIGPLPPLLAETIPHLPTQPGSFAVVCQGFTCQAPVDNVRFLTEALSNRELSTPKSGAAAQAEP